MAIEFKGTMKGDLSGDELWERMIGDRPCNLQVKGVDKLVIKKADGCTTKEYVRLVQIICKALEAQA